MSMTLEYCETRALEAAAAAAEAGLDNVRERALRSEAAWRAMADQIKSVDAGRKAIAARNAALRAAQDAAMDQPVTASC